MQAEDPDVPTFGTLINSNGIYKFVDEFTGDEFIGHESLFDDVRNRVVSIGKGIISRLNSNDYKVESRNSSSKVSYEPGIFENDLPNTTLKTAVIDIEPTQSGEAISVLVSRNESNASKRPAFASSKSHLSAAAFSVSSKVRAEPSSKSTKFGNMSVKLDAASLYRAHTSAVDAIALGLMASMGGLFLYWNYGLSSGFGSYIIAYVVISVACLCQACTVGELTSAFPFAGGIFGIARCSMGYYFGYILGMCELTQSILFVVIYTLSAGEIIACAVGKSTGAQQLEPSNTEFVWLKPAVWICLLSIATAFNMIGGSVFWNSSKVFAAVCCATLALFCIGSLPWVNFPENASKILISKTSTSHWFQGGVSGFLAVFPSPCWFYLGMPVVLTACEGIDDPRINVPKGMTFGTAITMAFSVTIIFVYVSLPPGLLTSLLYEIGVNNLNFAVPTTKGFRLLFQSSSPFLAILSLPSVVAAAIGHTFQMMTILYSLAHSKILPTQLQLRHRRWGTPFVALISGCLLSLCTSCAAFYYEASANKTVAKSNRVVTILIPRLFNIIVLCICFVYIAQNIAFLELQKKFQNLPRSYHSVVGQPGLWYSSIVWCLCIICVVGFQDDAHVSICVFGALICFYSILYVSFVQRRQGISRLESKILFKAHVVCFNLERTKQRTTRRRQSHLENTQSVVATMNSIRKSMDIVSSSLRKTSRKTGIEPSANHVDANAAYTEGASSSQLALPSLAVSVVESLALSLTPRSPRTKASISLESSHSNATTRDIECGFGVADAVESSIRMRRMSPTKVAPLTCLEMDCGDVSVIVERTKVGVVESQKSYAFSEEITSLAPATPRFVLSEVCDEKTNE